MNIHDVINKRVRFFDLHKGMVNECPGSRSLQDIVEVVLELPVARVSPAALRAVDERFPQQAQPGALLSPLVLRAYCTCCARRRQQTVDCPGRVVHRPTTGFNIFLAIGLRGLHPETSTALIATVVAGHRIISAGWKRASGTSGARI